MLFFINQQITNYAMGINQYLLLQWAWYQKHWKNDFQETSLCGLGLSCSQSKQMQTFIVPAALSQPADGCLPWSTDCRLSAKAARTDTVNIVQAH